MLGVIVSDIVGSRFGFNRLRSKEYELFAGERFTTDDSIMTLAVAGAIMETARGISDEHAMDAGDVTLNRAFDASGRGRDDEVKPSPFI